MQRHQKIMRSRYYKLARRRAIWDSQESYLRPWRHNRLWATRYCDYKPISSTGGPNSEPKQTEHDPDTVSQIDPHTFYKDFNTFRKAVDRAVERDPYGTLFGRRLQSPPSANNSSWTSFSWFTDHREIKEDSTVSSSQPTFSANPPAPGNKPFAATSTTSPQQNAKQTTVSPSEQEYEYDPISMRRVPRKTQPTEAKVNDPCPAAVFEQPQVAPKLKTTQVRPEKQAAETQPKQPFLQSLFFQEHGANIPVKTFKPHKVFGYGVSEKKRADTPAEGVTAETQKDFNSSRKQQLRDMMSRVKGNTIDTTFLFTEASPIPQPQPANEEPPAPKKPRFSPEPDDSLPLFSGTTYESKARKEAGTMPSDWLAREGFRQASERTAKTDSTVATVDVPVKTYAAKLEPSLDRVQARDTESTKVKSTRLQTALDRQGLTAKRASESALGSADVEGPITVPKVEPAKQTKRAKLEMDFEARQRDPVNKTDFSPKSRKAELSKSKLTKTLDNVWEHIREHPDGIVARTMKSMTNLNENYKKYIRPDAVQGLTDKIIFQDPSLSKVASIYKKDVKPSNMGSFTPSHDMLIAERERRERMAMLKAAAEREKEEMKIHEIQMSELAREIKAVYESEYGTIDARHRQTEGDQEADVSVVNAPPAPRSTPTSAAAVHPLSIASVKPGVITNPVIDKHVSKFEPKLARLVDDARQIHASSRAISVEVQELQNPPAVRTAVEKLMQGTKEVRRALHESQNSLRYLESRRPANAWTPPQISGVDFGKKRIEFNTQKALSEQPPAVAGSLDQQPELKSEECFPAVKDEETQIQPKSTGTPSGLPASNDELSPSIDKLPKMEFKSPYLILAYDSSTEQINFSPMNEPGTDLPKSSSSVIILSSPYCRCRVFDPS